VPEGFRSPGPARPCRLLNTTDAGLVDRLLLDFDRITLRDSELGHASPSVKYTVDLANVPALGFDEAKTIIKNANPSYAV
jgi:hypothetical protein